MKRFSLEELVIAACCVAMPLGFLLMAIIVGISIMGLLGLGRLD
jgi:hypothetical protein